MPNRSASQQQGSSEHVSQRDESTGVRPVLESCSVAILGFDRSNRVITANRQAARLHGFASVEELLARRWSLSDVVAPDDRAWCAQAVELVEQQGSARRKDLRMLRVDGTVFVADFEAAQMFDQRGAPAGFIGLTRETREQCVCNEQTVRQHKLESLSLLAGGIAHDFNNILTGILGNIGLAKMHVSDADRVMRRLQEAEAAIRRARTLTQQLLTFSKGLSLERTNFNLGALLDEAVPFALHGSAVGFELDVEPSLPMVHADEGQIAQVVHNLVLNAAHAMPSGGSLTVQARRLNRQLDVAGVEVLVRDTGEGIEAEQLPSVFDPYFTTKRMGHGLGLATSQAIILRHGGDIGIESKRGEGTEVRFWLPAGDTREAQATKVGSHESEPAAKGQRILVMDDDEVVRDVLAGMLDLLGFRVTCTAKGEEAIAAFRCAKAEGDEYAAVLVDLTVQGGMGGMETVEKLREIDAHVRALVSTGYADDPIVSHPEEFGFKQAVVKPFSVQELEQALNDVMSSG